MDFCVGSLSSKINGGEICRADSATTHTILGDQKYFSHITLVEANVNKISGPADLIDGSMRATIMLPCGTIFHINDVLYSVRSRRNLLSFNDIRHNGYHIETTYDNNKSIFMHYSYCFKPEACSGKITCFSLGLYYTTITTIELNMVMC